MKIKISLVDNDNKELDSSEILFEHLIDYFPYMLFTALLTQTDGLLTKHNLSSQKWTKVLQSILAAKLSID